MSDIFIKTSGQGSTGWRKASNLFVKTSGLGSTGWRTALGVWIRNATQWLKVWPLSGVFASRVPYIASGSADAYASRLTASNVIRIGTAYYGNNALWDANGWTITGYSYAWGYYLGADSIYTDPIGIIDSGTGSGWTTSSGQDTLPTSIWTATNSSNVDNYFLSFKVTATASNTTYNGSSESTRIKVVRQPPINLTKTLSSFTPQVGSAISYSSSWNATEAYKPEASRTTIAWYKNSISSTTGGTLVSSGSYTYTPQSSDLNNYIYAVETTYNSGSDYDFGVGSGVEAKVITTSVVAAALSAPTSTSISSVSRLDNTTTRVVVSSSGGSGPYYQLYWSSSVTPPVTANYDAAGLTSTVTEDFSFANGVTYYFHVRSSSQNLGNTITNGTATAGTYSAYGPSTGAASYTFQQPSGSVSVSPSTGTAGSTQFTASPSVSSAPNAQISYQWQYFEGGAVGWAAISAATSSTYTPPSNYVSLYGSGLRCQITANNGVGTTLTVASAQVTVSAPAVAPTISTLPTLSPTTLVVGTQLSAGIGTWNNSPTNYDIRIYRGTAGVITSETLVASRSGTSTANLTYTITQADYDSGQRYFRTYVDASNSGGSSGLIAGQERGPTGLASVAPTFSASSISPTSGTAGTTTFTASGTASGNPTPTLTYQWQYFSNSSFSYVNVSGATSSTYAPPSNFNTLYPNLGFYCLITATNSAGSATARPSATLNSPAAPPAAPGIPTGVGLTGSGSVSWTASTGSPTSYEIQFYTAQSSSGASAAGPYTVTGITGTSYQLTSPYASPNNYARVQVRARNSGGASSYSAWVPSSTTYT